MASPIYSAIASPDGYVEDEQGKFDWAAPDEEGYAFVNDLDRPIGTHLYGRRMYETMLYWETTGDQAAVTRDFAEIRRVAEKAPGRFRRCPASEPESNASSRPRLSSG